VTTKKNIRTPGGERTFRSPMKLCHLPKKKKVVVLAFIWGSILPTTGACPRGSRQGGKTEEDLKETHWGPKKRGKGRGKENANPIRLESKGDQWANFTELLVGNVGQTPRLSELGGKKGGSRNVRCVGGQKKVE